MQPAPAARQALIFAARALNATILETPAALIIVLATENKSNPDDLLPLTDAAKVAATSLRVVRDAIRAGDLPTHGKQRDRSVRRSDLEKWIESRRVGAGKTVHDEQNERVERILQRRATKTDDFDDDVERILERRAKEAKRVERMNAAARKAKK